jgi:hypothetical protein
MDFIEQQEFAAEEASRLRPTVKRLWWGLSALALLGSTGILVILLHAQGVGRQHEISHRALQEAINRLLAARGAAESVIVARFRSGVFVSGNSNCTTSAIACNSWTQEGPNEGPVCDIESLLKHSSSYSTVVIVEGAHDSQELSKQLRAAVRDNENLALARAEAVQLWLEGKVDKANAPTVRIFPVTRPTVDFEHAGPIDRTVLVTLIATSHDSKP